MKRTPEYVCTFDRIGPRNPAPTTIQAHGPDDLAEKVYDYAKCFILSRNVDVEVDLDKMVGRIYTGARPAGQFTIEEVRQ